MSPATGAKQDVKIVVHWLEKSRAQRILWLLEELHVDYDVKHYPRIDGHFAPQELKEVHPLGKSPIVTVQASGAAAPTTLAESGAIVEFLLKHFGPQLIPQEYQSGKDKMPGSETEEWLRYKHFMHYSEGSLMSLLVIALVAADISDEKTVKGITTALLAPNFETHFGFLEGQLASSPGGGHFLCGRDISGADILMEYPLLAAKEKGIISSATYPKLVAYLDRLWQREAYKKAIARAERETGQKFTALP